MVILVMGASGSGTSTIGEFLANYLGYDILESDFYKWEQTNPPFLKMRPQEESNKMILDKISSCKNLIISGSLHSNPDTFKYIDIIFYLYAPTSVRMKRILQRDIETGRNSLQQEGEVKEKFMDFLWCAENYDNLGFDGRSKASQEFVIKNCYNASIFEINTDKAISNIKDEIIAIICKLIDNKK